MPTRRGGYFAADGKKIPSVTTIISRFKESGGLIHWAWNLGAQGKDYRDVRDEAADAGTLAHDLVECWIRKRPLDIDGTIEAVASAQTAFSAFLKWAKQTTLQPVETEVGLVSERHRFAGTLDSMLVDGELSLGDWKTSNHVYADYWLQIAAYAILWEENFPDRPITGGFHLIRFSKEDAGFAHYFRPELEIEKRAFLKMRDLYEDMVAVKKRAA